MTPQVKDFDEFLTPAIPSTSSPFPPSPPATPPTSTTSTTTTTSASFFEDISHLEDPAITGNTNSNISGSDRSPYEAAPCSPALPPNATLTPMQLVSLSNLKLNSDMFSNRSLSIHRRILVKNFLTLLYQLNPPMDWVQMQMQMQQMDYGGDDFGPIPGLETGTAHEENMLLREDEQNGWMERTLSAAGLSDKDDAEAEAALKKHDPGMPPAIPTTSKSANSNSPATRSAPILLSQSSSSPLLSPAANSTNTAATQDPDVPLPRPKSAELPQSLHTSLSLVVFVAFSCCYETQVNIRSISTAISVERVVIHFSADLFALGTRDLLRVADRPDFTFRTVRGDELDVL
ncbi:hypothetical protein BGZ58_001295 [Dissophora ornata]|nr:hypothetical protein BGZ58_001295 [Dissophora ornata]